MSSSPSTGYWSALGTTILHPIDATEAALSELSDSSAFGGVESAVSGRPSQAQVDAIKQQTAANVIAAGGSQSDAQAAADEVQTYVHDSGGTAEEVIAQYTPSVPALAGIGAGTILLLGLIAYILHEV